MKEVSAKTQRKGDWTPSEESFNRFLAWLDQGTDTEGRSYLEMRERLVTYFDRKNSTSPDELADETLNRVTRRLEEEGDIESEAPAKYCYTIARYVFLESLRSGKDKHLSIDEASELGKRELAAPDKDVEKEEKEKMLQCLDHCTAKLDAASRGIIVRYYHGQEREKIDNRRAMAEGLGISVNALSIRACRIRDKLEACVGNCVERG
jgi:DNA-directed RNA polymerase specialized sigma24 family protein